MTIVADGAITEPDRIKLLSTGNQLVSIRLLSRSLDLELRKLSGKQGIGWNLNAGHFVNGMVVTGRSGANMNENPSSRIEAERAKTT